MHYFIDVVIDYGNYKNHFTNFNKLIAVQFKIKIIYKIMI